jgi:hypothetical protein
VSFETPPQDLFRVLAEYALGAPGVCALRALRRVAPSLSYSDPALLSAAAKVAGGFRSLFNQPEVIALLRGEAEEGAPYWRTVLVHARAGNLQALLDEQVHVLREHLGLLNDSPEKTVEEIAKALVTALSLRSVHLRPDEFDLESARTRPMGIRCRFALRYGDLRDDSKKVLFRAGSVQTAFNSPFRPFVLATTSIGQEGLDFHLWCHAVMHWNLPSNPVDLEQREGRVHRYKGYAVRKNLARRYGLAGLRHGLGASPDPWECLFRMAAEEKPPGTSDLVPYWVYEQDGGARVERRIPLLPFSIEEGKIQRLKAGLALYRLTFGQPRQEDLLSYLRETLPDERTERVENEWRISLEPRSG